MTKLEVKLTKQKDGLYLAELPDGSKTTVPSKEDAKMLATWDGAKPVWNKTISEWQGKHFGTLMSAPTLSELKMLASKYPDPDTYKILSSMPEYPTLYAPSRTKVFDKNRLDTINAYEDIRQAKHIARKANAPYIFEIMAPKEIISSIDRATGIFKLKAKEIPAEAIKRAMRANSMDYEPPNPHYKLKDYDGVLSSEDDDRALIVGV